MRRNIAFIIVLYAGKVSYLFQCHSCLMVVARLLVSYLALSFSTEGKSHQDLESSFNPIQIHVVYMDIWEGVAEAASFIRERGFPHVIRQLAQILTVRRMRRRKIRILPGSQISGLHEPIEFGETDLVVFVRIKNLSPQHFMSSRSIQYDSLGRPTVGEIEISFSALVNRVQKDPLGVWRSAVSEGLFHAMIHILGFAYSQFSSFRNPKSLTLRIADSRRIFYTCSIDRETSGPPLSGILILGVCLIRELFTGMNFSQE